MNLNATLTIIATGYYVGHDDAERRRLAAASGAERSRTAAELAGRALRAIAAGAEVRQGRLDDGRRTVKVEGLAGSFVAAK